MTQCIHGAEVLLWPVAPTDFLFRTQALIYYNFKQAL